MHARYAARSSSIGGPALKRGPIVDRRYRGGAGMAERQGLAGADPYGPRAEYAGDVGRTLGGLAASGASAFRCVRSLVLAVVVLACGMTAPSRADAAASLTETCYLFAYFYHDQEGEGLRLAWSPDGYNFEAIHNGASFLKPMVGESQIMRDPTIARGPDGTFHLVWTTSWDGKTIGHASSKDLIHWSAQQAIPVMAHEPEAQNSWAPEILWDEAKQHFLIYWSSTILGKFRETENTNRRPQRNHRIYSTTTKDFATFTPTRLHYDGGYNVIDAMIARNGPDDWLMFVKNEQLTPQTEKNIRLVRGRSPDGPWGEPSPRITGDYWAEGPSAIKVGDEWRVYFDKHMVNAIGLVVSRDLETWMEVSDRATFPRDARHPCVIAVPRDVVANLLGSPRLGRPVSSGVIEDSEDEAVINR